MKPFDPKNYVYTAHQTYKYHQEYQQFLKENAHLAAPFHVKGLEELLPKRFPGDLTVHFAKSHEGKSTAIRQDAIRAQEAVQDTDFMIALGSLEDNAETTAAKFINLYGGDVNKYTDDQMLFIGRRFGMKADEMSMLNIDNFRNSLRWSLDEFKGKKGFSHIYLDYVQIVPQSDKALSKERRDQAFYATQQLAEMASEFTCPVDFASQALLKQPNSHYGKGKQMRIPSAADLKEAGELYEIPGVAISYWMPKRQPDTPVGTSIEESGWKFTVQSNLIFVSIEKWRNCEFQKDKDGDQFDVVGRKFPCWIQKDGSLLYDKEKHNRMVITSVAEKEK